MLRFFVLCLTAVALCLSFTLAPRLNAADADPAVQKICTRMLKAIETKDRAEFIADGSDAVRAGTTDDIMQALSTQVGARMKKGYTATYLCELNQLKHQIYLWKLAFQDDGDDMVARVVMKDGKVAGFFFQ